MVAFYATLWLVLRTYHGLLGRMNTNTHPLREYRKRRDLTLAALASAVGSTRSQLSKIETGISRPSPDLARRLSDVTGLAKWRLRPDLWEAPRKHRAA